MYPQPFQYKATESLEEALDILAQAPEEVRPLAGGQSLIAILNLQLAQPACLLDLNPLQELATIRYEEEWVELGALVRHRTLETDAGIRERLPLLAQAAGYIGNLRVRNRGTLGGSLAHADPAAELGAVALALGATVQVQSKERTRFIPAGEFFQGYYTTALEPGEIVRAVRFPLPVSTRYGFAELVYRANDFAIAGAAVALQMEEERIREVRLALFGVADRPLRAGEAEEILRGETPSFELLQEAAERITGIVDPPEEEEIPKSYRRQMAQVMTRRALAAALGLEPQESR
ncbi:MAG: xanthine dehydrogenase family protein subunit M [Nitrospinota bacterium]|nr:MAG: xanthine dehydrogenase family protein subunit M [Nitrospinota bacterium]